jgi:hypothetical protein
VGFAGTIVALLALLALPAPGTAHVLPGEASGVNGPTLPTNDLQNLLSLTE